MSELKARHVFDVYEDYTKTGDDEQAQVYLKSEADEVISTIRAERDEYRYNLSCARNEIHNMQIPMREDVKRIADKDKVIAEKDAVIAGLKRENKRLKKEASCTFFDDCLRLRQTKRKLRHHKYKRCLAMAKWCDAQVEWYNSLNEDYLFWLELYVKWRKRWLELAMKFKEAK